MSLTGLVNTRRLIDSTIYGSAWKRISSSRAAWQMPEPVVVVAGIVVVRPAAAGFRLRRSAPWPVVCAGLGVLLSGSREKAGIWALPGGVLSIGGRQSGCPRVPPRVSPQAALPEPAGGWWLSLRGPEPG